VDFDPVVPVRAKRSSPNPAQSFPGGSAHRVDTMEAGLPQMNSSIKRYVQAIDRIGVCDTESRFEAEAVLQARRNEKLVKIGVNGGES